MLSKPQMNHPFSSPIEISLSGKKCSWPDMNEDLANAVIEGCLIHWFPELESSRRRDVSRSILAALCIADRLPQMSEAAVQCPKCFYAPDKSDVAARARLVFHLMTDSRHTDRDWLEIWR